MIKKIFLLLVVVSLFACGSDDNAEPPAELIDFKSGLDVKKLWSLSVGDGINQQFLKLYPLLLKQGLVVADRSGVVSLINTETGKILWQTELEAILSAGVGGNEQQLFVASRDGQLFSLDLNGKVLWQKTLSSEVLAPPVIFESSVIVRSTDGVIAALDAKSGEKIWSYAREVPALSLRGNSQNIVSDGAVFIGLDNGRLLVLNIEDGRVLFDTAIATSTGRSELERMVDLDGHAELIDGILYIVSYQGRLVAIDIKRGQLLWTRKLSSYTGVELNKDTVFSTDERDHVWAFDRRNGATLWKQEKLKARKLTRPVIVDNVIVVGDYNGYLHFMSPFDGHFMARVQAGNSGFTVAPVIQKDRLFVLSRNGVLTAFQIIKQNK